MRNDHGGEKFGVSSRTEKLWRLTDTSDKRASLSRVADLDVHFVETSVAPESLSNSRSRPSISTNIEIICFRFKGMIKCAVVLIENGGGRHVVGTRFRQDSLSSPGRFVQRGRRSPQGFILGHVQCCSRE